MAPTVQSLVRDYCPEYWIDQAIQAGSYNALLWMEQDLKLNLDLYQFPEGDDDDDNPRGRGLLHCLVDSPQGPRFFAKWASKAHAYHHFCSNNKDQDLSKMPPMLMDCLTPKKKSPTTPLGTALTIRNKHGQTFLHALVLQCNSLDDIKPVQALVAPSATSGERVWELMKTVDDNNLPLALWKNDQGRTPSGVARSLRQFRMAKLLNDFAEAVAPEETLPTIEPNAAEEGGSSTKGDAPEVETKNQDEKPSEVQLSEFEVSIAKQLGMVRGHFARGLNVAHVAAFSNRCDVLDAIAKDCPNLLENMMETEVRGRSLEGLAASNEAKDVLLWLENRLAGIRLSTLVASLFRKNRAMGWKKASLARIRRVQWVWKGHQARRKYRKLIKIRLAQRKRYAEIWGNLCSELKDATSGELTDCSWDALHRNEFNLAANTEHLQEYGETFQQLDEAAGNAQTYFSDDEESETPFAHNVKEEEEPNDAAVQEVAILEGTQKEEPGFDCTLPPLDNIKITKAVLTWIRKTEGKYVDFFLRRLTQLASGQRSRILQKNLVGSSTTIYETYLEQHCAQRILWTPVYEDGKHCILIWYVARHKEVSRLMDLIDASIKRSSREFLSAESLFAEEWGKDCIVIDPAEILLDPIADVPLKLHQVQRSDISNLSQPNWVPPLRLTPEERQVVDKDGTVLLLGRSGTGKTLCISNRIALDRDQNAHSPGFSQCFIARSSKICRLVRSLVGGRVEHQDEEEVNLPTSCKYLSFSKLMSELCSRVAEVGQSQKQFNNRNRVGFQRFKRELWRGSKELDPLVVWAQINNFIKGSISCLQRSRPLSLDEYLALGERECRLTSDQRKIAYEAFVFYQKGLQRSGLWDDSDRCSWLLRELKSLPHQVFAEFQSTNLYVDEIQDYSQVQLALFFTLSSNNKLFLAGDNAQSVEEGVDFRFESLRSVAHSLYDGDKRYIPEKPLTVNKNFRSHAGILSVAAAVLERLYAAFPASIHRLPPDEGLFIGPRPGILNGLVDMEGFAALLKRNPRLMVLMHDEKVPQMKNTLGDLIGENGVYCLGIRESKGLEFRDIVIVNFFSDLAEPHQKAWRELLRDRDISGIKPGFPQLEGQLKLLYTGITRCARRLFFVETKPSIAGRAFFRWLETTKNLAEAQDASKMETVMTPDEWRCWGVELCANAEETDDPSKALEWCDRAIHAFEQVQGGAEGDSALWRKAQAHRASLVLRVEVNERYDEFIATDEKEEDVADAAYNLYANRLLPELYKLVESVLPKLNKITQEGLEDQVLAKLQEYEP